MPTDLKQDAPPVPPTGGPCWIEIMSAEPQKLKDFYAALFPAWKFHAAEEAGMEGIVQFTFQQPSGVSNSSHVWIHPGTRTELESNITGLSSGIVKLPDGCAKPGEQPMGIGSTVYYFVDSIDKIETDIVRLGGVKVLDKRPERDHGWFANFKDPEGNRFGTFEANWAALGEKK
ncbi:uncharacterized protein K460DRAFT_421195 [Cucurbitaria berberidis CBS 394.84]|uniref:VOC domain-containing protein n=1 Tax=Cucurbitaria berberidis CBS 394.84 TaxID=1168544 RepID=A0A9P4G7M8_9PLEO|nr:uncharacterized protein K460DRAFT_421195 [Cucurbitaria berberidis CBS 394.84]KAF1840205.1 hypothetical protein K460DRAFT_421195 [Cucurbitaria berberidis CBS 394.84]